MSAPAQAARCESLTLMLAPSTPRLRPRTAITVVFAVHGAVMGSFATRLPSLQDHLHLGSAGLGLALLMPAIGSVVTMPFAGRVVHRLGGRRSVELLIPLACASLALPYAMPTAVLLWLTMLLYGGAMGMADVAMNDSGVQVERLLGRPIMSGLHGGWSIGGLIGSGLGALAAATHVDARLHMALAAAVLVLGAVWIGTQLPPDGEHALAAQAGTPPPLFALPEKAVLLIGLVGFAGVFGEASSADWCAVFLRRVTDAQPGIAALAYTGFASMMVAGRLVGDRVVSRYGARRTVRACGIVATAGTLLTISAHTPVVAIIGFALMGLGVSVVVPLCFAAAGRAGTHPGRSIAGVATLAYGAGMAAPASIGAIAAATSLRSSFVLVAAMAVAIALAAGALGDANLQKPVG
jgi:predicted MFS family arabinose efflux permease